MAEMKWYVLRTMTGKELKVKEYIDAAVGKGLLHGYVGQTLVPTEKVVQVRSGKRVVSERVMYSGYVYVQASMVGEVASTLRNMPNVFGILGGLDHPEEVRQADIDRMLGAAEQESEDMNSEVSFLVGEQVKVTEGPFSNFNGIVNEVNLERKKLTVLVKVFGRETALNLGFGQVEKL